MNNIAFSVSMCVYEKDNPDHFKRALESIINQTVRPSEVVLVVDGPVSDAINTVIKSYKNETWFRVIRLDKNVGHGNARRIGIENCKFDLVALMDADDISFPNRFEIQIRKFLSNQGLSVVGGNICEFVDFPENIVSKRVVPSNDADIKEYMKKRCPFNQVTVMFKKKDIEEVGSYQDWYCNEDYFLWIRMALANKKFANIEKNLVKVRISDKMYQRRGGLKYFMSEAKIQAFMLEKGIIRFPLFLVNIVKRIFVQILIPSKIRGYIYRRFAREAITFEQGKI